MEQRSEEWFAARCGKATASKISDIIAKTKSGWGAGRKNYAALLIAERLTEKVADGFSNAAMQWGTDTEPQARAAYSFYTDNEVVDLAFVDHPTIEMSGASPDGLVNNDGLVEIKCPNTATHLDTLLDQKIPKKYKTQMFWQMACTDRQWCDFVSYDPRLPENMAMVVIRLERDDELIKELEKDVTYFLDEISSKVKTLGEKYG